MAIRLEEEKKGKASVETFEPHQVKKNKMKKTNKKAFEGRPKKISKETIITIDERNNAEEERPYITRKKVDRTRKNKPGTSPKSENSCPNFKVTKVLFLDSYFYISFDLHLWFDFLSQEQPINIEFLLSQRKPGNPPSINVISSIH